MVPLDVKRTAARPAHAARAGHRKAQALFGEPTPRWFTSVLVCDETWRMLSRLRGARLTYLDASSLALMARHGIRTVCATDHHLGLTGAEVLPRS